MGVDIEIQAGGAGTQGVRGESSRRVMRGEEVVSCAVSCFAPVSGMGGNSWALECGRRSGSHTCRSGWAVMGGLS